jgi:hypothetical protein
MALRTPSSRTGPQLAGVARRCGRASPCGCGGLGRRYVHALSVRVLRACMRAGAWEGSLPSSLTPQHATARVRLDGANRWHPVALTGTQWDPVPPWCHPVPLGGTLWHPVASNGTLCHSVAPCAPAKGPPCLRPPRRASRVSADPVAPQRPWLPLLRTRLKASSQKRVRQ